MSSPLTGRTRELDEALGHLLDPNIRFPQVPRLIEDLDIFAMPEGLGLQIRGAAVPVMIKGRKWDEVWDYLQSALDGSNNVQDILASCPESIPKHMVVRFLTILHSKGLLEQPPTIAIDVIDDVLRRQMWYWGRHVGIEGNASNSTEVQRRLETARVAILATGLFGLSCVDLLSRTGIGRIMVSDWPITGLPLGDSLTRSSAVIASAPTRDRTQVIARLAAQGPAVDLTICATVGAPKSMLRELNRVCVFNRTPLLIANVTESILDLGPFVQAGETSCYECSCLREASLDPNAMEQLLYDEHRTANVQSHIPPRGEAVPIASLYASLVATEAVRVLAQLAPPALMDAVTTVDGLRGSLVTNHVPRVPRCPVCSRAAIEQGSVGHKA